MEFRHCAAWCEHDMPPSCFYLQDMLHDFCEDGIMTEKRWERIDDFLLDMHGATHLRWAKAVIRRLLQCEAEINREPPALCQWSTVDVCLGYNGGDYNRVTCHDVDCTAPHQCIPNFPEASLSGLTFIRCLFYVQFDDIIRLLRPRAILAIHGIPLNIEDYGIDPAHRAVRCHNQDVCRRNESILRDLVKGGKLRLLKEILDEEEKPPLDRMYGSCVYIYTPDDASVEYVETHLETLQQAASEMECHHSFNDLRGISGPGLGRRAQPQARPALHS
jgi:hypothetical protein